MRWHPVASTQFRALPFGGVRSRSAGMASAVGVHVAVPKTLAEELARGMDPLGRGRAKRIASDFAADLRVTALFGSSRGSPANPKRPKASGNARDVSEAVQDSNCARTARSPRRHAPATVHQACGTCELRHMKSGRLG